MSTYFQCTLFVILYDIIVVCSIIKYTVSFHNFKSQNFKLSVSNPKSIYVAYLSVLSRISNCQGLGRKNKHEILKTDRMDFCPILVSSCAGKNLPKLPYKGDTLP